MGAQQLKAVDKFRAGDIAANDNDARLTGCALPVLQRHRWIKKMLHAVKHKRHLNADQMYDAFHTQDVGPAHHVLAAGLWVPRMGRNRKGYQVDC